MENEIGTEYILEIDIITDPATNEYGTDANYKPVACLVTNGLTISTAQQNISNKCDGGWAKSRPGKRSGSFSGDGQAMQFSPSEASANENYQTLINLAVEGEIFFIRMTNPEQEIYREAKAYISEYSETAPDEEPYTFTASFVAMNKVLTEPPTS